MNPECNCACQSYWADELMRRVLALAEKEKHIESLQVQLKAHQDEIGSQSEFIDELKAELATRDAKIAEQEKTINGMAGMIRAKDGLPMPESSQRIWKLGAEIKELRSTVALQEEVYKDLFEAAHGLSYGVDWNKGTHAILHGYRQKLIDAVAAAKNLRDKGTLRKENDGGELRGKTI